MTSSTDQRKNRSESEVGARGKRRLRAVLRGMQLGDDVKINDQRTETRKGPGVCVLEGRGWKGKQFLFIKIKLICGQGVKKVHGMYTQKWMRNH